MPVQIICKFHKVLIKTKIKWLSVLPASLMKFPSEMKLLSPRQHFPNFKSMGAFSRHGD